MHKTLIQESGSNIRNLEMLYMMQALVALASDKLNVDIPIVMQDDVLLAHTIDETIGNLSREK
jgi:hypothetical protein